MHELIEFIKWCFKDQDSGFASFIILGMLLTFLYNVIGLFTPNKPNDEDEET